MRVFFASFWFFFFDLEFEDELGLYLRVIEYSKWLLEFTLAESNFSTLLKRYKDEQQEEQKIRNQKEKGSNQRELSNSDNAFRIRSRWSKEFD